MAFEFIILGSGAATPTLQRAPSAFILKNGNTKFLIDCGEGTQMQMLKFGISALKIDAVFISHLHGDHYLGLPGLISTMHLLGRKNSLQIIGPKELQKILLFQFELTQMQPRFELKFTSTAEEPLNLVYENKTLLVQSFPLKHRIFCTGFLFKEKQNSRVVNLAAVKANQIPENQVKSIKQGIDFIKPDGTIVSHLDLTFPPKPSHSFAYCSDTAYFELLSDWIKNVNLLYHEATFDESKAERAAETFHSTAKQAAIQAFKSEVIDLVIGHFSPRYKDINLLLNEAKQIFENTFAAHDGMSFFSRVN